MTEKLANWPIDVKANWPIDRNIGHVYFQGMAGISFRDEMMSALERTGMSIAELSRRSGVSYDVLNKLKRRSGSSTSAENAAKIRAVLGFGAADASDEDATLDAIKSELDDLSEDQLREALTFVKFLKVQNESDPAAGE